MTPESYCEHYNDTERSVQLLSRKQHLIKAIQQKEDTMRKLRLVQMYRTKVCKLVYTVDELFTFHESVRIFSSTSLSPTYPLPLIVRCTISFMYPTLRMFMEGSGL